MSLAVELSETDQLIQSYVNNDSRLMATLY